MTENRITDIRTVAVPVADQDRAVEFYVGKLGFEKRMDAPLQQLGGRWIVVARQVPRPGSRSCPHETMHRRASIPVSVSSQGMPPPRIRSSATLESRWTSC